MEFVSKVIKATSCFKMLSFRKRPIEYETPENISLLFDDGSSPEEYNSAGIYLFTTNLFFFN